MSALVCGLDLHKESTYATILGPGGEVVTQRRMPNEEIPGLLKPHDVEKVALRARLEDSKACNTGNMYIIKGSAPLPKLSPRAQLSVIMVK